ncbi:MAG TPA: L,D-transpeptidase [Ktedonobacterales bacterium]|nr:L,D-transpeptidase [Ktedonobacterales bacterium]
MKTDTWLLPGKRVPPLALWLVGLLLILLLVGAAGVVFQPTGRAQASAQPNHTSVAQWPAPPTPGPGSPPTPPTPPANARAIAARPPGLGAQQTQILAELGHPSKALLVSIDNQTLYVYQGNALLTWSYVTTGRPELQTPRGFYSVLQRQQSVMFYSKWPPGSPYYYAPVFVHYALRFLGTDFFLHDYSLRTYYGPGTNVWHQNSDGTWETGSHGCVETPLAFMRWLYTWADIGTPVVVY